MVREEYLSISGYGHDAGRDAAISLSQALSAAGARLRQTGARNKKINGHENKPEGRRFLGHENKRTDTSLRTRAAIEKRPAQRQRPCSLRY